jgi:2-(1,2-epoxy-1,2-dihydrophenyl)acetyl-CoA isomerase
MGTVIDTGTDQVLAEVADGVATITLSRPERRNALTDTMLKALGATLARVETDSSVGCVVLTGAGGAFCSGGDVKGMAARGDASSAPSSLDERVRAQRLSQKSTSGRLHTMAKPTIASIPGAAAGAGLSMALACDFRIAADSAVFTMAFATVALSGDYGSAWFLTHVVGSAKARELLMLPERTSASEALRVGLVHRVVPAADLEAETTVLARRLADGPRLTLQFMKENLNRALHVSLEDFMDTEVFHHVYSATTADHREAAQAFVDKRAPRFGQG